MRARTRRATTNVEAPLSSFVGRESDVLALASRLDEGRLVTLLGPGGMGKTRLAQRFASEHAAAYAARGGGGAWFCDLSESRSATDVVAVVAGTLGVSLAGLDGDAAGAERVGHAIAARGRVLIVLDNFDRVTDVAASTVGPWLRAARSARFLVTSRVPLALAGEQCWPLAPLAKDDAIELFVRRAREVRPDVEIDREPSLVGEIVDRVDCMPLAIELAATRTTVLSLAELQERLARPLDLLRAPRPDLGRHGSVRQVVLDSLAIVRAEHRRLFAACATLRNGFTLEAAEDVLSEVVPRGEVLEGLATLVRHSLLRTLVEPGDVARYALFETLRDVADEMLLADPAREALEVRHVVHYAGRCASLATEPVSRSSSLRAAARDLDNALLAHQRAHALGRASEMLDVARGLEPLLSLRGLTRVRARLFDEALACADRGLSARASAEAHLSRGVARRELGEGALAREDFERALLLAREAGDVGLAAVAQMRLGGIDDLVGDTPSARARMRESLASLAETPPGALRTSREAEVHLRLGHAQRREGELEPAYASILEAIDRYRALEHDEGLASAMYELAVVDMFAGRRERAFAHFDEGLAVAKRGGVRVMMGALKTARGCLLQDAGRLDEALEHHAEAARIFEELGSRYREGSALYYLATTFLERGDADEALGLLARAAERITGVGAPRYEALVASGTACALAAAGRLDAAELAMERAERSAARVENEPALAGTLRIHRLALALKKGSADRAAALVAAAAITLRHPSDDSRFAERTLRALTEGARATRGDALVVRPSGAAFALPGASTFVVVPERSPLRRIVDALATRRVSAPGEVLTIDDVIRVGWPGEKISTEAALNRAYVALASLRKLGLRGILLSTGGGYAFSRAVVVRIEAAD